MGNSRTKNSVLIIGSQGLRRIVTLLLNFFNRTIFIQVLGAEYLGLNGLFSNILSILALSELGIGSAMSYYLYKPVAEKNTERIKSLMLFYKQCYRVVGCTIIIVGACLIPVLPHIVNFEQDLPINLYLLYMLNVFSSASTYLVFAYKQAIITANQEQYKVENIRMIFSLLDCLMSLVVLVIAKEYIAYIITKIIVGLLGNVVVAYKVDKEYPYLKEKNIIKIKRNEWKHFFKDVRDVTLFRLGSTLFGSVDNIVISAILGTVIVGYYSNYSMLIVQVRGIVCMVVYSIAAGVGNVIAKEVKAKQYEIFKQLDFCIYLIAVFCFVCLFQLSNSFVCIWIGGIGHEYILGQGVVGLLCINFYIEITCQVMNVFRESSGHFEIGRTLQVVGGIANLLLSILLGKFFGLEGIFLATVITKIGVTIIPFIIGVSKKVFEVPATVLLKDYMTKAGITTIITAIIWVCCSKVHMTDFIGFMVECVICILGTIVLLVMFYFKQPEFKSLLNRLSRIIHKI